MALRGPGKTPLLAGLPAGGLRSAPASAAQAGWTRPCHGAQLPLEGGLGPHNVRPRPARPRLRGAAAAPDPARAPRFRRPGRAGCLWAACPERRSFGPGREPWADFSPPGRSVLLRDPGDAISGRSWCRAASLGRIPGGWEAGRPPCLKPRADFFGPQRPASHFPAALQPLLRSTVWPSIWLLAKQGGLEALCSEVAPTWRPGCAEGALQRPVYKEPQDQRTGLLLL